MKYGSPLGRFLLAGLLALAVGACEEDTVVDEGDDGASTPLRVEQIIANPKTAAAGDTVLMTADVRSSSNNPGDIPVLAWTATGGTFIEDDRLTVRWVAPASSDIYAITARATNSVGSATGEATVFVAGESKVVLDDAGTIHLIAGGPDFYYRRSPNLTAGTEAWKFIAGVPGDATPPAQANGFDLVFAPDLSFEAHWADTVHAGATDRPRHIYVGDFASSSFRRITVDQAEPDSEKRHQYTAPSVSPNSHLVAYQGWLANRFGAQIDSFHVFVYDLALNTRLKVTAGQQFPRSFFPTFSTDQRWLTFVSDPAGNSRWELYGAPVNGDVVDADNSHLVQLSSTGGSIVSGTPTTIRNPLKTWNPASPDLAILAKDGTLYIVQAGATAGTTLEVTGLPGTVLEMVWSPSGATLAVVPTGSTFGGAIYLVTGTSATPLLTVPSGDNVRDLTWSPDDEWIVYRRTRGSLSWFELLDVDAGVLTAPLAVTGTWPAGNASSYRSVMSLSPVWGNGDQLWMPSFGLTLSAEPGILTVNLAGAVQ
jgi:hypothetical protein